MEVLLETIDTKGIRSEIAEYACRHIIPRYAGFDAAHRENHAISVISRAMRLWDTMPGTLSSEKTKLYVNGDTVDREILFTAAACHDIGLTYGRERHHLESGRMIREDNCLKQWFDGYGIETIAQAAEDHRASGRHTPRSIYGMLVAEADRNIDAHEIIMRTIQYGLSNYPELNAEGHISRAVSHISEKYGRGGYLKLWIPWSDNAARLEELQKMIDESSVLTSEVARIYSETASAV